MTKNIYTLWNTYLRYSRLCKNSRWWHLTSLREHPRPFQPRKSYNTLTADNKMHLQSRRGGEGLRLHHLWPPSPEAAKAKDPLLHQHRPTTDTQGLLLLHLAASQSQELFCCCPNSLKNMVQWPAGSQEKIFLTVIISYWICAWDPTGDVAAEGSRTNLFSFVYRQYYPIQIPVFPYSQSTVKPY